MGLTLNLPIVLRVKSISKNLLVCLDFYVKIYYFSIHTHTFLYLKGSMPLLNKKCREGSRIFIIKLRIIILVLLGLQKVSR